METKYFVAEAYRYAESKKWEYKISGVYDTLEDAKQAYYSRGGAIIKATNDHAMVIIYDSYGNKIMSDYVNTYVKPASQYIEITDVDAVAEADKTYYVLINGEYIADTGVKVGDRVFGKYIVSEPEPEPEAE